MPMNIDVIWQDEDLQYRAGCSDCSFTSRTFDDEDLAAQEWAGHACS